MKKRIISLLLSVVVFAGCFIVNSMNTASVSVGAGNGVDERIETAKELSNFLAFVAQRDASNMGATYSLLAEKMSADREKKNDSVRNDDYESATIHISTQITAESTSSNAEYTNGLISQKQKVSRQLSIYINEESTYYISKGIFSLVSNTTKKEQKEVFNFNMEIAVIDNDVYIMFHDFFYVENNISRRVKPSMTNQWIEVRESIAAAFIGIDAVNRETMEALKEMIDWLDECDALDEETGITDLNKDDLNDLYWSELEKDSESEKADYEDLFDDDEDVKVSIDLSNAANPYISIIDTLDQDDIKEITTRYDPVTFEPITIQVRVTNKVASVQEINICNVNNTKINMNEDGVSLSIDEDDDDILFIEKEMKQDD